MQDPLVYQARRISNNAGGGGLQVWRKELVDGSVAVALYNAGGGESSAARMIPLLAFETVGFSSCDRVLPPPLFTSSSDHIVFLNSVQRIDWDLPDDGFELSPNSHSGIQISRY